MNEKELKHFSHWFSTLCNYCNIPIEIEKGAFKMIMDLCKLKFIKSKIYVQAIACIRIASKWMYDDFFASDLYFLDIYTGKSKLNWFSEEIIVLKNLNWEIRKFFEMKPPRSIVKVDLLLN